MGTVASRAQPLTCTPHFKPDADQPWITMDSITAISLWISPNTPMTLEDVAQLIENFAHTQFQQQVAAQPTVGNYQYQGRIINMQFRQQNIHRNQMTSFAASNYVRDGEPFNFIMHQTTSVCCVIV